MYADNEQKQTSQNIIYQAFSLLWRVSVTPSTFVVLSLLWCLDLGLGSVGAYFTDPNFAARMDAYPFNLWLKEIAPRTYPDSLWVYILVVLSWLMVISLLLCSINWLFNRRKRLRGLGEFFVHIGFLLIFTGFVVGAIWGERRQGVLVPLGGIQTMPAMGISLNLTEIVETKDYSGRSLDTVSRLTLLKGEEAIETATVRLNHPLMSGEMVIYPRGSSEYIAKVTLAAKRGHKTLEPGQKMKLANGDLLQLNAILQEGERRGVAVGPGILLNHTPAEDIVNGRQLYLTTISPGRDQAKISESETIRLASFHYSKAGRYDVHRDPGIGLVLWGTYLLGFGTVWAFLGYIKAKTRA